MHGRSCELTDFQGFRGISVIPERKGARERLSAV